MLVARPICKNSSTPRACSLAPLDSQPANLIKPNSNSMETALFKGINFFRLAACVATAVE